MEKNVVVQVLKLVHGKVVLKVLTGPLKGKQMPFTVENFLQIVVAKQVTFEIDEGVSSYAERD